MQNFSIFEKYLETWNLSPDGTPINTSSSSLLPVLMNDRPAMLKIARSEEEKSGARLMIAWHGIGAAKVYEADSDAILMERATGPGSLADFSKNGQDDKATEIICKSVATIHGKDAVDISNLPLVPLEERFRALFELAGDDSFSSGAAMAKKLLADPIDQVILHGDIHHQNILDFGYRGWLVIDPKGLFGERAFDYANIFVTRITRLHCTRED